MVEAQIVCGAGLAAVLARVMVAGEDVCPAELHVVEFPVRLDAAEQADDARKLHGEADTADLPIVLGEHLHLLLEKQRQGPLPRDDIERLVGCVK